MEYCPFCGADLTDSTVSFCPDCGKQLQVSDGPHEAKDLLEDADVKPAGKRKKTPAKKKKDKPKMREKNEENPEFKEEHSDDGYDGYYDDVLPPDLDLVKDGIDKELVKKVILLFICVSVIILMCVALLYVL